MKKPLNLIAAMSLALSALVSVSCGNGSTPTEPMDNTHGYIPAAADTVKSVLVVVDVQKDFFSPDGSLYVKGGEELPAKIAAIAQDYDAVMFSLDWHPADHCSFVAQGGPWPSHCVAYTEGAGLADEFAPILAKGEDRCQLFLKGTDPAAEEYGAFDGISECRIHSWFKTAQIVAVCGIAGDYCVKESTANILKVIPASKVTMLTDCIRSIDDGSTLASFIKENSITAE